MSAAFQAFGGVARVLLYDNLKSAVLERQGEAIRFHPTLLAFAGHYRFEPRPVAVARGNEKGRVERAIRYVRDNFFAARSFAIWTISTPRPTPGAPARPPTGPARRTRRLSVREAFAQEQPRLLALPDNPFPTDERVEVKVGKTPYVRFDLNDYSVPHTHVRRLLTVSPIPSGCGSSTASRSSPAIRAATTAARRSRTPPTSSAGRAQTPGPPASGHRPPGPGRARQPVVADPAAERGQHLGPITRELLACSTAMAPSELQAAIDEALGRGVPHPNAVRLALERRREARQLPPPVAVPLSAQPHSSGMSPSSPTASTPTTNSTEDDA